jgi:predicted transcriptional regulator
MSTLAEIQEAVTRLRDEEKKALSLWLNSQAVPELSDEDEQRLLHSLDEAIRDVDAGKGVPIEDVRKRVRSWVAK